MKAVCSIIALGVLCILNVNCESEEVTIETNEDQAQPVVLDPQVAEEIRKEREEERENAKHAAANGSINKYYQFLTASPF